MEQNLPVTARHQPRDWQWKHLVIALVVSLLAFKQGMFQLYSKVHKGSTYHPYYC